MELTTEPRRFGEHRNTFGFLRLLFASLVIVSHTAEYADGDRHREPLTIIFGTGGLSFGEISVAAFFIISGFLISGSYLSSPSIGDYLFKRIVRIYPGYAVAFLISIFVFMPMAGGADERGLVHEIAVSVRSIVLLQVPDGHDAFLGRPFRMLNGAMWTISYEFTCYLLVIVLGLSGILKRPVAIAALSLVLISVGYLMPNHTEQMLSQLRHHPDIGLGRPRDACRLFGLFLAGSAFYGLQHRLTLRPLWIAFSAVALPITLFFPPISNLGLATFGAYLIFAAAAAGHGTWLERVNNKNDISYGVYLYASPILHLVLLYHPTASLPAVATATLVLSCACGWASWLMIEKPALKAIRRPAVSRRPPYDYTSPPQTPVEGGNAARSPHRSRPADSVTR